MQRRVAGDKSMGTTWYALARDKLAMYATPTTEGLLIEKKLLRRVLGSHLRVPKHLHVEVIAELSDLGLVEPVGVKQFRILGK